MCWDAAGALSAELWESGLDPCWWEVLSVWVNDECLYENAPCNSRRAQARLYTTARAHPSNGRTRP